MSSDEENSEIDIEEYIRGGGFQYEVPLVVGSFTAVCSHDYMLDIHLAHAAFIDIGLDEEEIEMLDEDLGPSGDIDSAVGATQYIALHILQQEEIDPEEIARRFRESSLAKADINFGMDEVISETNKLAAHFSTDALDLNPDQDKITIPAYETNCDSETRVSQGVVPPRPPDLRNPKQRMVSLVLLRTRSATQFTMRSKKRWSEVIGHLMPEGTDLGPETHFNEADAVLPGDAIHDWRSSSTVESHMTGNTGALHSNSRPKGGMVMAVMQDGEMHNVGHHSYALSQNVELTLDWSGANLALSELFAATAGEGLACASGSHILHQMVSSVLAAAAADAGIPEVRCEVDGADIVIPDDELKLGLQAGGSLHIDITSTAGIWQKVKLRKKMASLSKYDLGYLIALSCTEPVAKAFAAAISCSLAVEHASFYGQPDLKSLPMDLAMQYRILNSITRMSQATQQSLSAMAYHAVVDACVDKARATNFNAPGRTFREKAQNILSTIDSLKLHDRYAVPPIPLTPITGLYDEAIPVSIMGEEFMLPSRAHVASLLAPDMHVQHGDKMLEEFPAVGLFPAADVQEFARIINNNMLYTSGASHGGPGMTVKPDISDHDLWMMASRIYAASSAAQFAEVRADVVRSVDGSPISSDKIWRSSLVYKGKVLVFFRVRDRPNSPEGYRIDWFAVSTFETIGSIDISPNKAKPVYLWPRQRMRSQEMEHAGMAPRRLKLTLFTMLTMSRATGATLEEIQLAWQKLVMTSISSTWASGANLITCRYLSTSLSSPSPPFDAIAKKLKGPKTLTCIIYLESLRACLNQWVERDQYKARCPLLGLPRAFSQLEAYWQVWVPDSLADTRKHLTDCVIGLFGEYADQEASMQVRMEDLMGQYALISQPVITYEDIKASVVASCSLDTGGKFGWSCFGSMASAYALMLQGSPKGFDRTFSYGGKARNMVSHLTVRHSARITRTGILETGTVAEMILKQGLDVYLSVLNPLARFFYSDRPYFMNHPKNGELKDREISITDPDSRIALNDAEHICGEYGRTTSIDMLKRRDKDAYFYAKSSEALLTGGVVQSSDASRFAAMMSNIAVAITCRILASWGGSAHLAYASSVYARLASRRMVLDSCINDEIAKRLAQDRGPEEQILLNGVRDWIDGMPKIGSNGVDDLKWYCTSSHTGQGMSHVGMSLEHGGALLISISAACHAQIRIRGRKAVVYAIPLVTSDDSTVISILDRPPSDPGFDRSMSQRACHAFLKVQRVCREIALRSVSVLPNLAKEKSSGTAGEFNSQDNGIGVSCPILGFREMICQLTRPSAPSLIGDLLNAQAYGRGIALLGMGLSAGSMAHLMALDAVEQRWKLTRTDLKFLYESDVIPPNLITGCSRTTILQKPASLLPEALRAAMIQLSMDKRSESDFSDIHARDLAFTILSHVSIKMKKQHAHALTLVRNRAEALRKKGYLHQANMLDQTRTALLSSARNRNIGRIAQRVRNRIVDPGPCLGHEFSKTPMLEATFTWIDFIASKCRTTDPSEDAVTLSKVYGSFVRPIKPTRLRFPEPITRRKSKTPPHRKPSFILSCYGLTPFGKHVVQRSGSQIVTEFGPRERRLLAMHDASVAYRSIPEHNLYGGKSVLSWSLKQSCVIGVVAEKVALGPDANIQEYWPDMSDEAVEYLRDLEDKYPDTPVLAFNYASAGTAHYHAVWRGAPYSCSVDFDPETAVPRSHHHIRGRSGANVVLALQGFVKTRQWYGAGPQASEISAFQHADFDVIPNVTVERLWFENTRHTYCKAPMAAALDTRGGCRRLYIADKPLSRSKNKRLRPYERAKFVLSIATGGYWYSAIKGVCARAFLKGHSGTQTCWTGPVLGWRMSRRPEPIYRWEPPDRDTVASMTVVGGVDSDEHISVVNPQDYANTHVYVDRSGLHVVDETLVQVPDARVLSLIIGANGGHLFFNAHLGKGALIDVDLPALEMPETGMTPEECFDQLWAMTHSSDADNLW